MATNTDYVYEELDRAQSLEQVTDLLRRYFNEQIQCRQQKPEREEDIAYEIAGLLSSGLMLSLEDVNPYKQIIMLAVQLELPEEHRTRGASWRELTTKVEQLR